MGRTQWLWLGLGILVGLSLFLIGAALVNQPYTYRGSLIEPPLPAAEIALTDQTGQPFELSSLRGQVVLLFFGYTACPDVCPTTLADFRQVYADLGRDAEDVRVVFVTVDPQRDTPAVLERYLGQFKLPVVGLTGPAADLQAVYDDYGVFAQVNDNGLVDHTARVYVIDRNGGLHLTFAYGTPPEDMAADLRQMLKEPYDE